LTARETRIGQKGLGWVVLGPSAHTPGAEVVLAGPYLEREQAVRADERERIARALEDRRDQLAKYGDTSNFEESTVARVLVIGLDTAIEIAKAGVCPLCYGSLIESGGVCKVCGVDYVSARAGIPNWKNPG
jgi:hypothetical protein